MKNPWKERSLAVYLAGLLLLSGCGSAGIAQLTRKIVSEDSAAGTNAPLEADPVLPAAPAPRGWLELVPLGGHEHGGASGAEISAYDATSQRLFTVNGAARTIDIQNISDPASPQLVTTVPVKELGRPTSVSAKHGLIAVSVTADSKTKKGHVLFLSADGDILKKLEVGYEPDMLTFTPDGHWLLVANEGEPTPDYSFDPEGSVSMIDVSRALADLSPSDVISVGFEKFNSRRKSLDSGVRIYPQSMSVAQDLEPEYIAVSPDSQTAWVTCQENNAVAVIDLQTRSVTQLTGLGFKDHNVAGRGLDASDKDDRIRIRPWPVKGMYQPDGIASFQVDGQTYLVTANEGELREFPALNEQARIKDLKLNAKSFPQAKALQEKENLGRLRVSNAFGDHNGDRKFDELFSAGTRSFSIWTADIKQVFDSGDQFERFLAQQHPGQFNSDHESVRFDDRSDNKGCEPESVAVGKIDDRTYAFIALERMGGILVYDVSQPQSPIFEAYINTRNLEGNGGDSAPEGVLFITPEQSPNAKPMLVVSYEISGTTRFFEIRTNPQPASVAGRE